VEMKGNSVRRVLSICHFLPGHEEEGHLGTCDNLCLLSFT
jgi:hypothetical protein